MADEFGQSVAYLKLEGGRGVLKLIRGWHELQSRLAVPRWDRHHQRLGVHDAKYPRDHRIGPPTPAPQRRLPPSLSLRTLVLNPFWFMNFGFFTQVLTYF